MGANDLGSALERATSNIFQLLLQKRQMDIQQQQFQQQLSLSERRLTADERASAFDRVSRLIPFLPPGTSIADNEVLHEDLAAVFEGQDPTDQAGLGGLVLNPETMENVLMPAMIDQLQAMPAEQRAKLMERGAIRLMTGEATSQQALDLQENIVGVQARELESIMKDPELMKKFARHTLKVPDQTINVPGLGPFSMTSDDAARLGTEIWKHQSLLSWYDKSAQMDTAAKNDVAKEFIALAGEKKILLSRARAMQIINAVHYLPPDAKDLSDEEIHQMRQEQIDALRTGEDWNPTLDAALKLYISGADVAFSAPLPQLEGFPGLQNYLQLGEALKNAGLTSETVSTLLPIISKQLSKGGQNIARRRFGGFDLGDPPAEGGAGGTERQQAEADAVLFREGKITASQLTKKWGAEKARGIILRSRENR